MHGTSYYIVVTTIKCYLFIAVTTTRTWLMVIKYTDTITKKDLGNISHLSDEFEVFIITIDTYESYNYQGRTIHLIPLWLLTLAV